MPIRNVEFKHAEETFGLRFSQNAKYRFERESGMTISDVAADFTRGRVSIVAMQCLFWSMLEGWRISRGIHRQAFTIDRAGDMIDEIGLERVSNLVVEAVKAGSPPAPDEPSESGGEDSEPPPNPTTAS